MDKKLIIDEHFFDHRMSLYNEETALVDEFKRIKQKSTTLTDEEIKIIIRAIQSVLNSKVPLPTYRKELEEIITKLTGEKR